MSTVFAGSSMNRLVVAGSLALAASVAHAAPTNEELYEIIKAQQEEIDALNKKSTTESSSFSEKLHLGGYGEAHYNNLSADDSANDTKEIDFHRFVFFAGYDFSDRLRFRSEIELEHSLAGEGQPGEVELEQAYIEYDFNANAQGKAGVFLIPVGIINETHEPPTFYGVERNSVESIIIPATWWAGGAAYTQRFGNGFSWDFAVHEGLAVPTVGGSAFRIRSGRQKTAEALANDLAATTRIKYAAKGLELAASVNYQSDISQQSGDGLDEGLLYSAHAVFQRGIFGVRALYAGWDLQGNAVEAADADSQTGWYIEPSIKPFENVGFYARYSDLDAARSQDQFDEVEIGVNYWLHPKVVLKADFRTRDHDNAVDQGRNFDGFDLGVGFQY